ncbi:unnamed protein product [Adineta ricciae]|uniref:Uncharacterized protein n=1 Tax=Adineta ricciae TaxID=249248 RepID=A0A816C8H0_ADIRI|nr:unnamed protein product [Adineta ricciae]
MLNSSSDDQSPFTTANNQPAKRFVNERYPKTCYDDIPSTSHDTNATRSRRHLHFHTQPITLAEINETDEEAKNENTHQQESQSTVSEEFQRLEHLALSESRRRSARKKLPLKNYLERQRLKATREEPVENETN